METAKKRGTGYTRVPHEASSDPRLTADALALLLYIASHNKEVFQIRQKLILNRFTWTKDRYYKARDLLEALGYLQVEDARKKGQFTSPRMTVIWRPDTDQPCPKKTDTAKPTVSEYTGYGEQGHLRRTTYKNGRPVFDVIDYDDR